jgi:sugar lactone lactonase YvrE
VQSFSVATEETSPIGLSFKDDGTKMYVMGISGDDVNEYSLSTAWDISTASYVQNFSVASQETNPYGVFFRPDGTQMFINGTTNENVHEYVLSTPWDVSTASFNQTFLSSRQIRSSSGIFFKSDGKKMYISDAGADSIWSYDL